MAQVLIVDDSPTEAHVLKSMLEKNGYEIEIAESGVEGIERAKAFKPDLVLMDVVMPGMNGPNLVQQFHTTHPDMKVLYISGYTGDAIAQHGVLDEGIPFLQKPFTEEQLLDFVKRKIK